MVITNCAKNFATDKFNEKEVELCPDFLSHLKFNAIL